MSRRTIAVVAGGLRQPSSTRLLADRLAEATAASLRERGIDVDVQVVELREHAHDLTNTLLTGFASADLQRAIDTVVQADGLIAVTPIFSGSYSGLFKNFFDVLEQGSLAGMPVLIGATAGTARHSLALEHAMRPLFAYLHSVVVPTSVFGATEDFGATSSEQASDDVPPLQVRVERAAGELADLVAARSPHRVVDPFANPTSFEDLLAGR
jgi:FMN reductase